MDSEDSLALQRLIDGECSEAEIRSLLDSAIDHPDHWQNIATAFIEDQIWQRQFQNKNNALLINANFKEAADKSGTNSKHSATTWPGHFKQIRWVAMAACLMLAAMTGYFVGQENNPVSNDLIATNPVATQADRALKSAPTQTPKITPASLQADYHLQLVDDQGTPQGSVLDGEIPLYSVNSPEQLSQIQQPKANQIQVPPEILEQLALQGVQVRQDVNYISGNLKDGRTFVVPVRTINFFPGQ